MKSYKFLIPLALVALMALSFFNVLSSANGEKKEYESLLKEARRLADLEVVEDSMKYYQEALEIRDTIEINIEIGQVYVKNGWLSEAIDWGEYLVEHFPKEPQAYNFLLEQLLAVGDYDDCFELREAARGRNAVDETFNTMMKTIEYVYDMGHEGYEEVSVFSSGLCPIMVDGAWGYADVQGDIEIKPQFAWAGAFSSDGIAPVQTKDGEFYYISTNGNKKIAVVNLESCMGLGMSIGNVHPAGDNGTYSYYNQDFEKVFEGSYTMARPMNGGIAAVEETGKWYLIDQDGKKIIKDSYDMILTDEKGIAYRNDRVFVKRDTSVLMLDAAGKQVGNGTYEDACIFFGQDSYAAVKQNGKWGFVDKEGKVIIEPQYEEARSFSNGMAAVLKDGNWGFIDTSGDMVIANIFKDAKDMNEKGCAFVYDGVEWNALQLERGLVD